MKAHLLLASVVAMSSAFLSVTRAADPAAEATGPSVTIYSSADPTGFDPQQYIYQQRMGYNNFDPAQIPGFGVVKELRTLDLKGGDNKVSLTNVAAFIDPTTVSFSDLTDPATAVLDQQFVFDLVSPSKLLDKYLDQDVTIRAAIGEGKQETVIGKLLSNTQGQIVLQTTDGLRLFNVGSVQLQLGKLPDGLITKPTLQWHLATETPGSHKVRTTYQTGGLTWRSDYTLVLNKDDTQADLGVWVTLLNLSGTSYPHANLKLIAGDVQRIQPQNNFRNLEYAAKDAGAMGGGAAGFQEKAFFEYHLYTLPRPADIVQNATQQIALFPTVSGVNVEKTFVYYGLGQEFSQYWGYPNPVNDRNLGTQGNKKVDVYIKFKNEQANKLGIPLPRGKVRVYKQDDADGTLEFIGEDLIDHTPKDSDVLVKLGQAFDITGERVQTDFSINEGGHVITESIKITLKNPKREQVSVIVRENLFRWVNWEITDKSDAYEKQDSRTIHFNVKVPAEGQKEVTYTVRYTW